VTESMIPRFHEAANPGAEEGLFSGQSAMRLGIFVVVSIAFAQLRETLARAETQSRIDPLTGVPNVRSFYEAAQGEIARARRHGDPLTIAYLDLDDFKRVNDRLGHSAGDELLRVVAETIRQNVRTTDILARLGGDEFAVLFPELQAASTQTVVEKLRRVLGDVMQRYEWPLTFSIGVAHYVYPPHSVEEMVREADNLMYEAKRRGKNQVNQQVLGREETTGALERG
jgi:diguanylate cyclase (GGDEF)-like protein